VTAALIEEVLVGLADPMRRRILDTLASRGGGTATTLAAELPVSRQAVVKHLAVLDRAGLVVGRRSGREVRYLVRPDRLAATAQWMAGVAVEWGVRSQGIKRLAESMEGGT
jgi:DNA-binding transcriptional ArsR family regulator